jgi:type II restriction/modification system DNA methylase subunit YeeA
MRSSTAVEASLPWHAQLRSKGCQQSHHVSEYSKPIVLTEALQRGFEHRARRSVGEVGTPVDGAPSKVRGTVGWATPPGRATKNPTGARCYKRTTLSGSLNPMSTLSVPEFVSRWQRSNLTESAGAQSHFIDLCDLLGQPRPAEADQEGNTYTFEKGVSKASGGGGFADVWMRNFFAWEYKGKHKDLNAAYQQLLQYREDLDNPPLLVVCDFDRFEIHTNYTNTQKQIFAFELADLLPNLPTATCKLPPLDVLRAVFTDPARLKPGQSTAEVTEGAAAQFSRLAESLRSRGVPSERAAHFLMRLLFCLFSEDIGLLPDKLFRRLVESNLQRPAEFTNRLRQLFSAMAGDHGSFGEHDIAYFDGGLFSDDEAYDLTRDDLVVLALASELDWSSVEPAIFGTLFERSLDPDKRSQLGAHYTSEADIRLIVEPVLMEPLRRRWVEVRQKAVEIVEKSKTLQKAGQTKSRKALSDLLKGFATELSKVRVLDPACGSGNFLYVALKRILDLEKEVSVFAANNGLSGLLPLTSPEQLYGIETNVYAHELASVVVWIGYIQWQHDNGFPFGSQPILRPLKNIKRMDAVLAYDEKGQPVEPEWPEAFAIIGNPPFLGGSKMRFELGEKYVDDLFGLYKHCVPPGADLVCYWYERSRAQIERNLAERAGLLATQAIRGGVNRRVLERIRGSGDIFMAWSDRDWVLDGAAVHVAMVGFDSGREPKRTLNGAPVKKVNADLTSDDDLTRAVSLGENRNLCYRADEKGGPFDITREKAEEFLRAPLNINGRPNSDVLKPWVNAKDIVGRPRGMWIIDFYGMQKEHAAAYELPFEFLVGQIEREKEEAAAKGKKATKARTRWWLHRRPGSDMREAVRDLSRYIGTIATGKFRLFVWLNHDLLPDHQLYIFAREDDYFFGVLHSRIHEAWARATGTQTREAESGFRYTPESTFETFPFPWPPSKEPEDDPGVEAIAAAARELVQKRDAWLNPPNASAAELKKRTLTNLYNENPTWLQNGHRELDEAVLAAYGWPKDITDQEILWDAPLG